MNNLKHKLMQAAQRKSRVRNKVSGTESRPRLSVFISNHHVSAQVVDDTRQHTLAYVTTVGQKLNGTKTEKAIWVGTEIAKKAKSVKVKQVVFDRGRRLYHGRVAALAEAARKEGMEF